MLEIDEEAMLSLKSGIVRFVSFIKFINVSPTKLSPCLMLYVNDYLVNCFDLASRIRLFKISLGDHEVVIISALGCGLYRGATYIWMKSKKTLKNGLAAYTRVRLIAREIW